MFPSKMRLIHCSHKYSTMKTLLCFFSLGAGDLKASYCDIFKNDLVAVLIE